MLDKLGKGEVRRKSKRGRGREGDIITVVSDDEDDEAEEDGIEQREEEARRKLDWWK